MTDRLQDEMMIGLLEGMRNLREGEKVLEGGGGGMPRLKEMMGLPGGTLEGGMVLQKGMKGTDQKEISERLEEGTLGEMIKDLEGTSEKAGTIVVREGTLETLIVAREEISATEIRIVDRKETSVTATVLRGEISVATTTAVPEGKAPKTMVPPTGEGTGPLLLLAKKGNALRLVATIRRIAAAEAGEPRLKETTAHPRDEMNPEINPRQDKNNPSPSELLLNRLVKMFKMTVGLPWPSVRVGSNEFLDVLVFKNTQNVSSTFSRGFK